MVDKSIFHAFWQKGKMQSFPSVVCVAVSDYNSLQLFSVEFFEIFEKIKLLVLLQFCFQTRLYRTLMLDTCMYFHEQNSKITVKDPFLLSSWVIILYTVNCESFECESYNVHWWTVICAFIFVMFHMETRLKQFYFLLVLILNYLLNLLSGLVKLSRNVYK